MSDAILNVRGESGLIDTVVEWLVDEALGRHPIEATFGRTCERLEAVGVPVARATLSFATLHPQTASVFVSWKTREGVNLSEFAHDIAASSDAWKRSPFFHLLTHDVDIIRRRLRGPDAMLDFEIAKDLAKEGYTDYLVAKVNFESPVHSRWEHGTGVLWSWATRRESGFSEFDIAALLRVQRRLALACKVAIQDQITHNLVNTYLGRDASRRVLAGEIRRGDGTRTHAVVWYSDLRNSTRLADTMESEAYLSMLNTYFEATAGAVHAAGGDILAFIGDAVLAIFPIEAGRMDERGECPARKAALASALDARVRIEAINAERRAAGDAPIEFGIGLHIGDVVFGNIGIPERLSFSVIGPTMNEVARLEGMTKVLGCPILATRDFVDGLETPFRDLGSHVLRGVGTPYDLYTPVIPPTSP